MGEYLYNLEHESLCKLGTCENWCYIRRDECFALRKAGNYVYASWEYIDRNDRKGPIFRFPWPDEDYALKTGNNSVIGAVNKRNMFYCRCYPMSLELAFDIGHREFHIYNPKGIYAEACSFNNQGNWNLPCPNSKAAAEIGTWDEVGCRYQIQIIGERQNPNGWYTIFGCPYCDAHFALESKDIEDIDLPQEILERVFPFIPTDED